MKIEPRHNTKRPAYAVAAMLTAATMLSGCGSVALEGAPTPAPTEYTEVTDITAGSEELITDGEMQPPETEYTEVTDITAGSEELMVDGDIAFYNPVPDPCTSASGQYDAFMDIINRYEANNSGVLSYSFSTLYDRDREEYFNVLTIFDGYNDIHGNYVVDGNGDVCEWYPDDNRHFPLEYARRYEQITELPFLVDTSNLVHAQITEDGPQYNLLTEYSDSIDDGTYFGEVIGVTGDGTRALLRVGTPISYDLEEMQLLGYGDIIGYDYDFTAEEFFFEPENDFYQIDLDSSIIPGADDMSIRTCHGADPDKLYLCSVDGTWWLEDQVIVEVPISGKIAVTDNYEYYIDIPQDRELTGNSLTDSGFWYYINEVRPQIVDNGWIATSCAATPLVIENGELTSINLEYTANVN